MKLKEIVIAFIPVLTVLISKYFDYKIEQLKQDKKEKSERLLHSDKK